MSRDEANWQAGTGELACQPHARREARSCGEHWRACGSRPAQAAPAGQQAASLAGRRQAAPRSPGGAGSQRSGMTGRRQRRHRRAGGPGSASSRRPSPGVAQEDGQDLLVRSHLEQLHEFQPVRCMSLSHRFLLGPLRPLRRRTDPLVAMQGAQRLPAALSAPREQAVGRRLSRTRSAPRATAEYETLLPSVSKDARHKVSMVSLGCPKNVVDGASLRTFWCPRAQRRAVRGVPPAGCGRVQAPRL